ncbi:MAG TPA: hypothetical protein PKK20_11550 [Verrucomicrobiota bacterium]|nr:hypothetical protein [Verrucomicrobiota bacterium]
MKSTARRVDCINTTLERATPEPRSLPGASLRRVGALASECEVGAVARQEGAIMSQLDFNGELRYLAQLTAAGLKPLSRWEGPAGSHIHAALERCGLCWRTIHRTTRSGHPVAELVFSTESRCLDLYSARFEGRSLDRTLNDRRFEGWLFGYPSCCIESYLAHGYRPNALEREDQRLLFHWACPRCQVTPILLPDYRRLHRACLTGERNGLRPGKPFVRSSPRIRRVLRQSLAMAASFVALGAFSPAAWAGASPNPHQIPLDVWTDADRDGLDDAQELLLGLDPNRADQDNNGISDGVDWALKLSAAIDALPGEVSPTQPYRLAHMAFGLETCSICGEAVNMGFYEIVNPLENLSAAVPCIAKHYLEHGSLVYAGSEHEGVLNVPLLRTALESAGQAHLLLEGAAVDRDRDGLRDDEERLFNTSPDNPDSDADGLLDGIETARKLRAQLDALPQFGRPEDGPGDRPFAVPHPMYGIETCPRCGQAVVMDIWHVYNLGNQGFIEVPSMALHYLKHGAFAWEGGQLAGGKGRVDPRQLLSVLTGQGDGHQSPVSPDQDEDLLTDREELDLGTDPANGDENANHLPDGADLAAACAARIAGLPVKPSADHPYRLDFELKGLERCAVCGTNVNMGHLTVCNARAGLYATLPYIALHHLEHGSFSHAGSVHGSGRLDPVLLRAALDETAPSHFVRAREDGDEDGLTGAEEKRLGTDPAVADTDGDGVPDGFAVARRLWESIVHLTRATTAPVHAVDHLMRGLVTCPVCGKQENMGYIEIVNVPEQMRVEVSYLALHFLRHGSLGNGDGGRLNPRLIHLALEGDGGSHAVIVAGDSDRDGLLDSEERALGTDPERPDTNGDGIVDGAEAARSAFRRIGELPREATAREPYALHAEADCYVPCEICGVDVNCGFVELVQPWAELRITLSYRLLHFMEHGSFAASLEERADPLQLEAFLRPSLLMVGDGQRPTLRWYGALGRRYQVQTGDTPSGPWRSGPEFYGANAPLTFTVDSTDPAPRRFFRLLVW